jgi:hypothetical protein
LGEESETLHGVAGEDQHRRHREASEEIENWLRRCPVALSAGVVATVKLLVGLAEG